MAKKSTTKPTSETKMETTRMSDNSSILELDMNLADYEDFEPLPAREYPAEIIGAERKISDKGNEYYQVQFNIHPEDFPVDYDPANAPEGAKFYYNRLSVPDPKNRRSITAMKKFLTAIGISLKTSVINPGEWEGKKCKVVLRISEWNGEPRNEIQAVEALD